VCLFISQKRFYSSNLAHYAAVHIEYHHQSFSTPTTDKLLPNPVTVNNYHEFVNIYYQLLEKLSKFEKKN